MSQTIDMSAIRKLSHPQRLALITRIWDTLAEEDGELPISDVTKTEVRRRIQELKEDASAGKSHAEVLKWLKARSRQ